MVFIKVVRLDWLYQPCVGGSPLFLLKISIFCCERNYLFFFFSFQPSKPRFEGKLSKYFDF